MSDKVVSAKKFGSKATKAYEDLKKAGKSVVARKIGRGYQVAEEPLEDTPVESWLEVVE